MLAYTTGRRIGSIRCLAWSDIDLTAGKIWWRAAHDKKGRDWIVPIPETLRDELRAFRVKLGGAFGGLCFPSEADAGTPIRTDVLSQWLCQPNGKRNFRSWTAACGIRSVALGRPAGSTCLPRM